ncbi:MAG TPA: glycosyltransferase [Actinospica sp.]|nr:glycosyltransferase [Actinospica sp.]
MRIGFFSDRYLPFTDGIACSMEDARRELEDLGHEVYVFAPKPDRRYSEQAPRVTRFPAVKGLFFDDYRCSVFYPPRTRRQVEKLELDLVHFHTPGQIGMFGVYYARRYDLPLVTTYHTDLYEYVTHYPGVLPGVVALSILAPYVTGGGAGERRISRSCVRPERSIDRWNQKVVERGMTLIHNSCDLVITPSAKMTAQLGGWNTTSRIATLPSGVDEIVTTPEAIAAARREHGIDEDEQVVLFVGRIGSEKNLGLLIDAFGHVAAGNRRARLLLIGPGDEDGGFREQAAAGPCADRITFTGRMPRADLGAYYALAEVFAFPSTADTQALVVNEAAWAGTPIVMVDRNISQIVEDGVSGLFAPNTAEGLAERISTLLDDPERAAALGRAARERAGKLTAGIQAAKLARLYEETASRYRSGPPELPALLAA